MLSIFSCACWPSACLLWINFYLDPLPSFDWVVSLFFILSCLHIFESNSLSLAPFTNIFFYSVDYLFILFIVSFAVQKLLSLIRPHLFIFVFISITLGDSSEKAMAPHSSTLAWKIPWTEEPGRLQSMGSLRVGHDRATSLSLFTFMHWRRKWQPTPVLLPGESQGWGSLVAVIYGVTQSRTRLK